MTPIRRIVCATDFSRSAGVALDWATRFAQARGADLHVVHAWHVPVLLGPPGAYLASVEASGALEATIRAELEKVCEARPVAGRHLLRGRTEDVVHQVASEVGADLIVAGTTGGSALAHVVFGSVGERILRTAVRPVVLVPKSFEPLLDRGEIITRILLPMEMQPEIDPIIHQAVALARQFHATLDVVHVAELTPYFERHPTMAAEMESVLAEELRHVVHGAAGTGPETRPILKLGEVGKALLDHIEAGAIDLVIMRAHTKGAAERFLLGSTTEKLIRTGGAPVMVLPG